MADCLSTWADVDPREKRTVALPTLVDVDDAVLVDILEDVRRVHENADGAGGGDGEEEVQLQTVDHHRHVLPVLADLPAPTHIL